MLSQPPQSDRRLPLAERLLAAAALREQELAAAEQEKFRRYRELPDIYARDVLGITWWSKQIEIAHSIREHRRTAVYSGHGTGKTHGMGGIVQWHFDCWNPGITLTTAPNWSSIHDLLWGEIKAQRPANAPGRMLDMRLETGPMHYAKGHNAESSSGFQGRHEERVLIVADEAMGIPSFIWDASDAMMSSPDCRMVVLGNPTETSGRYYDIRDDPAWNVIAISCLDHPNIAAELAGLPAPFPKAVSLLWVQEMIQKHCEPQTLDQIDADCFEFPPESGKWYRPNDIFRPRVMGVFPKQAARAVWSELWLVTARKAALDWTVQSVPEIGCDVARYGDDATTIWYRRGPVVLGREKYQKQGTMETCGRVCAVAEKLARAHGCRAKEIPIKVDDTGLGGGVTDRLNELGYNVYGINFGGKAHDREEFKNRGSEMWFDVAYRARDNRLDLSRIDEDAYKAVSRELRARQYKIQSDRTLAVESKDDYIKRVGNSPDDADGLVLAFAPTGLWESIVIEPQAIERPKEQSPALVQQVRDRLPHIFTEEPAADDEEPYKPICGQCIHWQAVKRLDGGTGKCTLRLLGVDGDKHGCELHELSAEDE